MILPQLSDAHFQILVDQDRDLDTDLVWQYESAYFEYLDMFETALYHESEYTCDEIRLMWIPILESIVLDIVLDIEAEE